MCPHKQKKKQLIYSVIPLCKEGGEKVWQRPAEKVKPQSSPSWREEEGES
jgi:hypothetical protein